MEWDPCTFNNNDWQAFPTYDPTNVALNWAFLASQGPQPGGITQTNFTSTFRPWAIALQDDKNPNDLPPHGPPGRRVPTEWNMFGTHGVSFVQHNEYKTTIIGGDIGYQQPVTSDPIIGGTVRIAGDGGGGPGRLVDTNPVSPWSSQIYFGKLDFTGSSPNSSFSGPRVCRMHSRWLNPSRIYNANSMLTAPASAIGVCFQTCIPYGQVSWPASSASPLITHLKHAASQPGAQGIMVRFAAYVSLYFMNGILNSRKEQPRNYEDLAALLKTAWDAWNANGSDTSKFFSNPCYSHIVGAVGVWNDGELASAPGGRCLAADAQVAPLNASAAKGPAVARPVRPSGHELRTVATTADTAATVPLGPAAVHIDYTANLISLDFNAAVPELGVPGQWQSNLVKADFGPLAVGVMTNGNFTSIATIDYTQYQQSAYEAKAGIIDIPFPSGAADLLRSGALAIQAQGQTALLEQAYTAETDTRGIYLDQNGQTAFGVTVCQGGVPKVGATVLIAQYDSGLNLVPASQPPFVAFTTGEPTTVPSSGSTVTTNVTIVQTDANGYATVGISAQNTGFPVLAFFPYSGGTLPQPPVSFDFTDDAFYTTVRVLPFDDSVPQDFVDCWNKNRDQAQAWNFIYGEILYVYDMLFNVMLRFVNLGNRQAVESNIGGIWPLISEGAAAESTNAMPITRDMSAGKRRALQLWIYLVANNYNVPNFNVNSIPAGWAPS
jgi:hypothetical protein